ncbi:ribonuclease III [Mycoplasmatota bacterium]|nr:ribonuclease III [Mycoplasmatota bacterium]
MVNYKLLNGVSLAYIGDAYYDLWIRQYLINKGYTKVNDLHKLATKYVSATAQAKIINHLMKNKDLLEEEIEIVKRGRNAKINHKKHNVDILTYKHSTSFESLIGYLYLMEKKERLNKIILFAIELVESW